MYASLKCKFSAAFMLLYFQIINNQIISAKPAKYYFCVFQLEKFFSSQVLPFWSNSIMLIYSDHVEYEEFQPAFLQEDHAW